ncbi:MULTISPECIES: hypothetical protein [Olivibacter]|uniref:Virion structural protein n=1 Tax=Olivibacter jilunii TaxID=985016 RepID=A0ABW6AX35_9SPHI
MQSVLLETPERQVSLNNFSRFNAGFNPIVFKYQRNPEPIIFPVATKGQAEDMNGDPIPNTTRIGAYMSVSAYRLGLANGIRHLSDQLNWSGIPKPGGYFTPTDPQFNIGIFLIPVAPESGDSFGTIEIFGYPDDYTIVTEVTSGGKVITFRHSPGANNVIRADISSFLRSLVSPEETSSFDRLAYNDPNLCTSYTVRFAEAWGTYQSDWEVIPGTFYVTYSAMQLLEKGGGNMMEYVTFLNEPNPDKLAKWLTDFYEPIYWLGLPYDISFILNDELGSKQIYVEYTALDINKAEVNLGIVGSYILIDNGSYLITGDGKFILDLKGNIQHLTAAVGVNRILLPSGLANNVKYLTVQVYYLESGVKHYITQKKTIRIGRPCPGEQMVYLKWINHLGAWDYFRFGYNIQHSLSISNDVTITRAVLDWENTDTFDYVTQKTASRSVDVGADFILPENIKALEWLLSGIKPQMLVDTDPYKWQTVTIQPGTFPLYNSQNKTASISLSIDLPKNNIQHY